MQSIAELDSGNWSWVDYGAEPFWSVSGTTLRYRGQVGYLPLGDALFTWPDGQGVEWYVTWPYDGPSFELTFDNDDTFRAQMSLSGYSSTNGSVTLSFSNDNGLYGSVQGLSLGFRATYFRMYRKNNALVFQCREAGSSAWQWSYETAAIPAADWAGGWRGTAHAEGYTDWHYLHGVTPGESTTDPLHIRMPDQTWKTVGVASDPLYVRIMEGGTQKWVAYGGGGGTPLSVRTASQSWMTVSTRGGQYGIVRGALKYQGQPLANRPVWINRQSDADYSVPMPGYQSSTNDDGEFQIAGFPLGDDYRFSVQISDLATGGWSFTSTADNPLEIVSADYG